MTIFDPFRPRPERLPTPSFADAMLMDVARRVQLSPTKHDEAQQHFEALCSYVDRSGSPLQDKVIACYPSPSILGALPTTSTPRRHTIRSSLQSLNLELWLTDERSRRPTSIRCPTAFRCLKRPRASSRCS